MKLRILFICLLCFSTIAQAQLETPTPGIRMLPDGGCVRGVAGEVVGVTDVMINYGRPAVRGREGKIWGSLIPEGFSPNPFFKGAEMPWRAGANENTTVEFSTDVTIEGQPLKAGKYGLHMVYGPEECIVIFSGKTESWGSFYYEDKDDVLRVNVKPEKRNYSTERLTYEFSNETDSSATISVVWEKLAIPFTVSTELQKNIVAGIEETMNGVRSFNPSTYTQAARYYYKNDIHLDKALQYAQNSSSTFRNFYSHHLQYLVLKKLGRIQEADSVIDAAIADATKNELHRYGHVLLGEKAYDKALMIFKKNYAEKKDDYKNIIGMMKACSGLGAYKKAIRYAKQAMQLAPDDSDKKEIDNMLAMLKNNKDINS